MYECVQENPGSCDRALIADLYQQYYSLLLQVANGILHNSYDAEDVVQDLFTYALMHPERFRMTERYTMRSFLVLCIKRKSIDALRRRETRRKYIDDSADVGAESLIAASKESSCEDFVLNRIAAEELNVFFRQLPLSQQQALECKYALEMTDREIGTILGLRSSSVRACLTRARKSVNRICNESGYAV